MKIALALAATLALVVALGAVATWLIARHVEARFLPTGRFVDVRGGRLHVIEAGAAGPPGCRRRRCPAFLGRRASRRGRAFLGWGGRAAPRPRSPRRDRWAR